LGACRVSRLLRLYYGLLVATVIGVVAGLIVLALSLRYEHRRLTPVVLSSPGSQRGDELEL
jgi:hypothetical protein